MQSQQHKTMKRLVGALLLLLVLASCSMFEPGGSFNPLGLRPNSSLSVKAGSSSSFNIFVGSAPNIGLSPALMYRNRANHVPLSGSDTILAQLGIANLSDTALPAGWGLSIESDEVEIIARSSSNNSFNTIQTSTEVAFGTYRINGNLQVPRSTPLGTYQVQARIGVRNASPVVLEWAVTVDKP
jgi:hypothetical protein